MTITLHNQTTAPNAAAATSVSPLDPSGSSKTKYLKPRTDIYQTVTDSIITALGAGVKPWSCPWQRVPGMSGLPSNYATGMAYSGMNIMLLWFSASKQGFSDSRWMTYKQAQGEGGQVRKGEHGTVAVFYTTLEKENDAGDIDHIPMLKTFTVFNVEQIDGLPLTAEAGACQGSCRLSWIYAARVSRSGFSHTSSCRLQFRVAPDQRCGFCFFAASYTDFRCDRS